MLYEVITNNVRRHAGATSVGVRIEVNGRWLGFEVRDDGVGFDPTPVAASEPGLGLANLKRRAHRVGGTCRIESSPGGGTCVIFQAPLGADSR